jgi:hypothetical protein
MKRTARNILKFLPVKNGQFCVEKLPSPITYPESEREQDLAKIIQTCEYRKTDMRMSLAEVHRRNHRDILSAISALSEPLISVTQLLSLLMSCAIELDNECLALRGEYDALAKENKELRENAPISRT